MTIEESNAIRNLCFEYAHKFHPGDQIIYTDTVYREIKTPNVHVVYSYFEQ